MKTLVVGATGMLGGAICRRAAAAGHALRALVRDGSDPERVAGLRALGAETVLGDLKDPDSLRAALDGVAGVITTATSIQARRDRDDFETVDERGQRDLIDGAAEAGVERFVYVSYSEAIETEQPLGLAKRSAERHLHSRRMPYTILRPCCFMEIWLGPHLCIDAAAGTAEMYGSGRAPVSWISYHDVAEAAVRALDRPEAANRVIEMGGPEALSQLDAVAVFEEELGRPLRVHHVPEETLEAALESADHELAQAFAGLKLSVARGAAVENDELASSLLGTLRTVRDHARGVAGSSSTPSASIPVSDRGS